MINRENESEYLIDTDIVRTSSDKSAHALRQSDICIMLGLHHVHAVLRVVHPKSITGVSGSIQIARYIIFVLLFVVYYRGQVSFVVGPVPRQNKASMASQGDLRIISRAEWGARQRRGSPSNIPPPSKYFIQHSAGPRCDTEEKSLMEVRKFQKFHMDTRKWDDIGYNFVVGEDGRVYEGRGWCVQGAHTKNLNNVSHGICVIGTFIDEPPNQRALDTLQRLMQYGVDQGHVTGPYTVHGHRDGGKSDTESPGQAFYDVITSWPNYGGPVPV